MELVDLQRSIDAYESESVDLQKPVDMYEPKASEELSDTFEPKLTMGGGKYPLKQRKSPFRYSSQYVLVTDEDDPKCYKETIVDEHKKRWQSAMQEEMNSLHERCTYDLVELPKGKRALRNKWVFKLKNGKDGNSPRYKARILVKGFQ